MVLCALHQSLRRGVAVFFQQPLFKAAAVDADADGDASLPARRRHGFHVFLPADIAGVYAYGVHAPCGALQRQLIVKMYVRHYGQRGAFLYFGYGRRGGHIRHGKADYIAAQSGKVPNLGKGGMGVGGFGVAHGLHRHLRAAAHRHIAHI